MSSFGYITAPRLSACGQLYQGDIFTAAPFLVPTAEGTTRTEAFPAVLLTPTCDFALKSGGDIRHLYAIEVFKPDSPLLQRFSQGPIPQHLLPLPPVAPMLPHGGAVHFRKSSPVHKTQLESKEGIVARHATLNEAGLRALLMAHTRYYLRLVLDPSQIPIPPDDPRLLWHAIDAVDAIKGYDGRRDALMVALTVAINALARHYGIAAPGPAPVGVHLYRLAVLSQQHARLPAELQGIDLEAIQTLVTMEYGLRDVYGHPPQDKRTLEPQFQAWLKDLEIVSLAVQARNAPQIPEQVYRNLSQRA